MTSGVADTFEHPLASLVAGVQGLVQRHGGSPAWTVRRGEIAGLLSDLVQAQNALDSVRLRLLREADRHQLGNATGETSTAHWWARLVRVTRPAAHHEVRMAQSLDDSDHQTSAEALAAGEVSLAQAAVILDAVHALPTDTVDTATRRDVETLLVAHAAQHDPRELKILGKKALDVIAPEIAEDVERRALEAEEQHAAATASFTMRPDGHGSMIGRFKIPTLAGQMLAKHLNALAAPKHRAALRDGALRDGAGAPPQGPAAGPPQGPAAGPPQGPAAALPQGPAAGPPQGPAAASAQESTEVRVARPLRLGTAFTEYIETRTGAPHAGGMAATVVVTMTLANLTGTSNSPATILDTGETITAGQARRLACEAGIIPAILGTRSHVLDLGRKTRFHTEPQRLALALRDQGCSAEHCDWPPGMCHAHHDHPWSHGGHTNLKHGRLLCPRHHTLAHDPRYQTKTTSHGKVTFTRRT